MLGLCESACEACERAICLDPNCTDCKKVPEPRLCLCNGKCPDCRPKATISDLLLGGPIDELSGDGSTQPCKPNPPKFQFEKLGTLPPTLGEMEAQLRFARDYLPPQEFKRVVAEIRKDPAFGVWAPTIHEEDRARLEVLVPGIFEGLYTGLLGVDEAK